jgi:ATP:ADP antiporter, AAA family
MGKARAPRSHPAASGNVFSRFTNLRPGEAKEALLLTLAVFLLLTSYYMLKVVREPLILSAGGAELKSYTSAAQALLLVFLIPIYSRIANRVNRIRLISIVTLFFISNILTFYVMAVAGMPGLGVAFFVWVGIFNLMIIAQYWSFANDVYTPEQGKRLFAILGLGQTLGATFGGAASKLLIGHLRVHELMLVAGAILAGYLLLIRIVHMKQHKRSPRVTAADRMIDPRGGFALVARDRYLLLLGLLLLVLNFVNTNGEYILGRVVTDKARELVSLGATNGMPSEDFVKEFIGEFYADYFTWVSALTAFIQIFLVARIMQRFGVRVALCVLPVVALGAYGIIAFLPVLALIRAAKIGENSLDYSLNNTVRQALFLPTSREAKYKAKAAIDTLFVRAGDLSSAGLVFAGTMHALQVRDFALINMGLVVIWLCIVMGIARRHRALMEALPNDDRQSA